MAGIPRESMDARAKGPIDVDSQLAELQRKYRILEANRKAYAEDSQTIIRRQRAAIEKLQADNTSMKRELDVAAVEDAGGPNLNVQQEILHLRETAVLFTHKIEAEKKRVSQLDEQIRAYDAKALQKRKVMGGVNAAKDDTQAVAKQIKLLENKLEAALIKLNEAVGRNKVLRENIDHLRRERVTFDQVYRKIERDLHDKKREMSNVIDITNLAREARDQARNEIAALRAQNDKEQTTFDAEFREVGRLIEEDRKARDAALRAEAEKIYEYGQQEDEKRKKASKGHWQAAREKKEKEAPPPTPVVNTDEALARIQAATGITRIEDLVEAFVTAEDQSFSMFNFVNELNQEAERLEEQAVALHQELEKSTGGAEDSVRSRLARGMHDKLAAVESRAAALEAKYVTVTATLDALKATINRIFDNTGCNTAATRKLLGDLGITESNVLQYLALIEQRASEIMALYTQKLTRAGVPVVQAEPSEARSIFTQHGVIGPSGGNSTLVIEPPSAAEEFDLSDTSGESEEEDDRPLTREELAARMQRKLAQQAASKGGKGRRRK